MKAAFTLAAASSLLAVTSLPAAATQRSEFTRPTYAGAYEPQGVDERGLWMQIDELERTFRDSPSVVHDRDLTSFVKSVLCKTVGDDRCFSTRVYVINDSSFNAAMFPNGLMLVNTGLLARLHSESELATVLGHEFAHFELRHSLNEFRKRRSATDIAAWLGLGGAATGVNTASAQNSVVAGYFAFGREQEAAADELSAKYILASNYKLDGSTVWRRLIEEGDALKDERGIRKIKKKNPSITDSHPTDDQRFRFFKKVEDQAGDTGDEGVESYRAATSAALPLIFSGMVKGNDFAATDYVIRQRGEALGWDAGLLFMRGELYRLRGNPRDLVTAREFYSQAIALPEAPGEAWRGLGLCDLRLGEQDAGRNALSEYLARVPGAADAATIKMLVEG